jgi:hypothetical protein
MLIMRYDKNDIRKPAISEMSCEAMGFVAEK